jgi:hypothetical protein
MNANSFHRTPRSPRRLPFRFSFENVSKTSRYVAEEAIVLGRAFLSACAHRQSTGDFVSLVALESESSLSPQPLNPGQRRELCYSFVLILIIDDQGFPLGKRSKSTARNRQARNRFILPSLRRRSSRSFDLRRLLGRHLPPMRNTSGVLRRTWHGMKRHTQ